MAATSTFLVKDSSGTYALRGPPSFQLWNEFKADNQECRFTSVSANGNLVAVANNTGVNLYESKEGKFRGFINQRMLLANVSPNGGYVVEWNNPNNTKDNFRIWSTEGKEPKVVFGLKLVNYPDCCFSGDEKVFARLSNNSIIFSEGPDFKGTACKTPDALKIAKFSVSPGTDKSHVCCFIPSSKSNEPSFARIYRYPHFDNTVASKTFFQADRVEIKWNRKGNAVLLITSTDVDKTGQSYYGKTMLHYLDIKGETAVIMLESDSAVIHAAEWSPNSSEFAIISGKMPHTKAALMNTKCEVIFDMGIVARNAVFFNPQGNLLLLCGFGNLAHGKVEVWEIKKHKKMIAQIAAPTTTQLEWLNDGVHFVTAITAPRMQVGNQYAVWNYQGKEIHKKIAEKHLFGIVPFRSEPPPAFPEDSLEAFIKAQGNKPIPGKVEEQKKASVYVPPSKRGVIGGAGLSTLKGSASSTSGNKGSASQQQAPQSTLSDKEKKIRALKKKLEQIEKIKQMIKDGKPVEKNQEDKLKSEAELLEQMRELQV